MSRRWLVVVAAAIAPRAAFADRVSVKVIEVAGDVAYVTPGKLAGIAAGNKATFGADQRTVLEVTDDTASIKLDGLALAIGQTGSVDAAPKKTAASSDKALRAEPLVGQWPEVITPAQVQTPKHVPLGGARRGGAVHVTVVGSGYAAASRDHGTADGDARLIASWDILTDRPLAADVDVSGRMYSEGYDKQLRVPVFVHAAQLRYGSAIDPRFALGRLRFAASSVGMLDGARGAMRFGDVEIAAFGGIVPDPVSGKPDTSASRFGAEATYDLSTNPWRPRIGVTASGSTWSGQLDERRLAVNASANHDALWLDGWAEAQQFAANNPWGASAIEFTGAGATAEWRQHGTHLGIDLDFMRPERSLRLAAVLPPEWLCSQEPQPGDVAETCASGDYWTTATASAGTRSGRFTVDAYGTIGRSHLIATSLDTSAYIRGEVAFGPHRLFVGGNVGKSSFGSWDAGELGVGTRVWKPLDLAVRYRAELLDYVAATSFVVMHAVAADLRYPYSTSIDLAMSAIGTTGPDRTVAALLATIVWRPLP